MDNCVERVDLEVITESGLIVEIKNIVLAQLCTPSKMGGITAPSVDDGMLFGDSRPSRRRLRTESNSEVSEEQVVR